MLGEAPTRPRSRCAARSTSRSRASCASTRRSSPAGKKPAPNARNAAAGSLRQLNPSGHRGAPALDLRLRGRRARGCRARVAVGGARMAASSRLPHEPGRAAPRHDRRRRRRVHRVGGAARRARIRDRRHRDQARLVRPAAPSRLPARPPALRARVQVGADLGGDAPDGDPRPGRPHRRAEPARRARAGARRRRHRDECDAAQRRRHPTEGHSRGRPRDRPARR